MKQGSYSTEIYSIKDGDIITLQDGSRVKVSLDPIKEIKLEVGGIYKLNHDCDEYCYTSKPCNSSFNPNKIEALYASSNWIFVNEVSLGVGSGRNIFMTECGGHFAMFSNKNTDYILKQLN